MTPGPYGQLPPDLLQALRRTPQAPPPQQAAPQIFPVDQSNPYLAPVDITMTLGTTTLAEDAKESPAMAGAWPGGANHPKHGQINVVIFTVRTVCQTFTALWDVATARANVQKIRDHLSAEMPLVIMPPGAPPDLRRITFTLTADEDGQTITVPVMNVNASEWADLIERAANATSGLLA